MVEVPLIGLINRYLEHTNRALGHTIYHISCMPLSSKFELQKLIVAISLQFFIMSHDFYFGFLFLAIAGLFWPVWVGLDLGPNRFESYPVWSGPIRILSD